RCDRVGDWPAGGPGTRRRGRAPWLRPPKRPRRLLFAPSLIVSSLHDPAGAPLRRPLEAPLLIGSFGDDGRDGRGLTVLVERHEREVTRIRVALLAGDQMLGDDLDPNLHRRLAGVVHAREAGEQLAHVDRLAEIDLVHRHGDALLL